jgi:thiol-disulfide isomerase/thioredoxin
VYSYPTAYASVMLLTYFPSIDTYFPDLHAIDSAVSVLNLFSETSVTNHTQFAFVKDQIKSCIATSIGKPAPEILQPDTAGQTISLSGLKGKYVFLDFWASWCLPCRKANSYLATAYKKYSSKNFTILSISLDENRSDWIKAIHKDGMTWINTSELKANNNTAQLSYGVKALPANFLIDPTGKIVAKGLKAEQLEKQLAVFLK